jgi:polyvinyl alcohol dehydrogenase (cytochrome)
MGSIRSLRLNFAKKAGSQTSVRKWLAFGVILGAVAAVPLSAQQTPDWTSQPTQEWPSFGQNPGNTSSSTQTTISTKNVAKLQPKWVFTTGGDVSARAAVVDDVAYFPDWAGNLWAVCVHTGKKVWSHQLSDYGLPADTVSRTSPAVADGKVYIGTQTGGWLLAIDAKTGALAWKVQAETVSPYPMITASPTVVDDVVYTGYTSNEEDLAAYIPDYVCCTSRGSIIAVNAHNGTVLWKTYTVPEGYSGGNIWGSSPVVDKGRHTLYIGTGNNYSIPTTAAYGECLAASGTDASCLSSGDHVDSILAIDTYTGAIEWSKRMVDWYQTGITNGIDFWNVACFTPPYSNCPSPAGPDYDFGSAPNEITYQTPHGPKTIIGAGQKSGIYYAFDPDTGAELWQTQVGPGSSLGGIEWGSSTDGKRIYIAISNYYGIPSGGGSAGFWAALNPADGAIVWETPDPNGAIDLGPVTAANDVVYTESMSGTTGAPTFLALNALSGKILWSYAAGSSVIAGASIAEDTVFWGSGYTHLPLPGFTGNTKFYAFTLNGK